MGKIEILLLTACLDPPCASQERGHDPESMGTGVEDVSSRTGQAVLEDPCVCKGRLQC